jgi:hypothetical protein
MEGLTSSGVGIWQYHVVAMIHAEFYTSRIVPAFISAGRKKLVQRKMLGAHICDLAAPRRRWYSFEFCWEGLSREFVCSMKEL